MTAGYLVRFKVMPGRMEEFLAVQREEKTIAEELGAQVRTQLVNIGGTNTGMIQYLLFFDSAAQRGQFFQDYSSNPARGATGRATQTTNPMATVESSMLLNEIRSSA